MNTMDRLISSSTDPRTAFTRSLQSSDLQVRSPAALAHGADPSRSPTYVFLSTTRIIEALRGAGFVPVSASQSHARRAGILSAAHVIRFRRRYETVQLRDCIPEILCLNSHNGRTALAFRLALYRPVCTNGLIVCDATMPVWKVPHRGDVFDSVIAAVVQQAEQFSELGTWVERMERTALEEPQRLLFAASALEMRFPSNRHPGMQPQQLLEARRAEDIGDDLWRVYNRVQENVIKGELARRTASNRLVRTRPITSINRDVQLNTALWRMATALAA